MTAETDFFSKAISLRDTGNPVQAVQYFVLLAEQQAGGSAAPFGLAAAICYDQEWYRPAAGLYRIAKELSPYIALPSEGYLHSVRRLGRFELVLEEASRFLNDQKWAIEHSLLTTDRLERNREYVEFLQDLVTTDWDESLIKEACAVCNRH